MPASRHAFVEPNLPILSRSYRAHLSIPIECLAQSLLSTIFHVSFAVSRCFAYVPRINETRTMPYGKKSRQCAHLASLNKQRGAGGGSASDGNGNGSDSEFVHDKEPSDDDEVMGQEDRLRGVSAPLDPATLKRRRQDRERQARHRQQQQPSPSPAAPGVAPVAPNSLRAWLAGTTTPTAAPPATVAPPTDRRVPRRPSPCRPRTRLQESAEWTTAARASVQRARSSV